MTSTDAKPGEAVPASEDPFAHLRASPEKRARILASLTPFDVDAWLREITPATPQELAEWDEFLREREREEDEELERERKQLEVFGG